MYYLNLHKCYNYWWQYKSSYDCFFSLILEFLYFMFILYLPIYDFRNTFFTLSLLLSTAHFCSSSNSWIRSFTTFIRRISTAFAVIIFIVHFKHLLGQRCILTTIWKLAAHWNNVSSTKFLNNRLFLKFKVIIRLLILIGLRLI